MSAIPDSVDQQTLESHPAKQFLSQLDPTAKDFLFVAIHPNRARPPQVTRQRVTDKVLASLQAWNEQGFNIFVTVNATDDQGATGYNIRREKEDVCQYRAIFIDDDGKTTAKPYPLTPSFTVQTSPGKKQVYWFLSDAPPKGEWDKVQQTLVNDYGGDPNARDAARILRLPGFRNTKPDYTTKPLATAEIPAERVVYTWAQIRAVFPLSEVVSSTGRVQEEAFDIKATVEQFMTGANYHDAAISLVGHFYSIGVTDRNNLILHMQSLIDVQGDQADARFDHRRNEDIPASVDWVLKKRAEEVAATAALTESIGSRIEKLTKQTKAAEVKPLVDAMQKAGCDELQTKEYYLAIREKTNFNLGDLNRAAKEISKKSSDMMSHSELADTVIRRVGKGNLFNQNFDWYVWGLRSPGLWSIEEPTLVNKRVDAVCQQYTATHYSSNTIASVKKLAEARVAVASDTVGVMQPHIVNVPNGELYLMDGKWMLFQHNKQRLSTIQLLTRYDAAATCLRWNQFLDEIFEPDADRVDKKLLLQELIGYAMTTSHQFNSIIVLEGFGANGKSRVINVIRKLVGARNCSSVQLKNLDNEFHRAHMQHKLVNLCTEVGAKEVLPDGEVKAISDGEAMTVAKKYGAPFDLVPTATMVIATNNPLYSPDTSYGLIRRLRILSFNRKFVEGVDADLNIDAKLEAELSGIMVTCLQHYADAVKRGALTMPVSVKHAQHEMKLRLDQVALFVKEECRDNAGGERIDTLFQYFRLWAGEEGIRAVVKRKTFKERLLQMGYLEEHVRGNTMIRGIGLTDPEKYRYR